MLDQILKAVIDSTRGLRALLLVDRDGMLVSVSGRVDTAELEVLAASYTDIARRIDAVHREAQLEPLREVTVTGPAGSLLYRQVADEYGVLALLEPEATLGRVRFELRKLAGRLLPELVA